MNGEEHLLKTNAKTIVDEGLQKGGSYHRGYREKPDML